VKITHVKIAPCLSNNRGKRVVTICTELGGPSEFMTITVSVPSCGSDEQVCQSAIAKAKGLAKHFAELPSALFPTGVRARLGYSLSSSGR
jgi:hypothetical protein